ncbi:MAG: SOS response-associated peptidase [Acidovorax sp.]|uniref:SOS response-associated peptidase n=1 Tax=Acidovorax sp. TaxID=1872122 RepID=UPI00391C6C0E
MSTHYETLPTADAYSESFAVAPPEALGERHLWPRKPGFFIVHAATAAAIAQPTAAPAVNADTDAQTSTSADAQTPAAEPNTTRVLVPAQWGLVPHWVKSASDAKLRATKLVNAKSDTASTGTAFRDAWLNGQRCIVPMNAFYEDDLRSGKAVPTRVARVDGKPMGVAGLWARWQGADGEVIISYCLLNVNANNHALLHRYGQPGSEKSMPAILNEGAYDAWLTARPEKAKEFMRQYAAQWLLANPVEKKADKIPKGLLG